MQTKAASPLPSPPASPETAPSAWRPSPRSALLALLLIAPAPSLGLYAGMVLWPGQPIGEAAFVLCKIWLAFVPLLWTLFIDRQRLSLSPMKKGGLAIGAILGVAISIVILATYFLFGDALINPADVQEAASQNAFGTKTGFLALAAYWILINSVIEEYVFRWFIFSRAESLMPRSLAVIAAGLVFTLHHIIAVKVQFDWTVTGLITLGVFIGGVLWSWLYLKYRSIWPGYLSHAIVDIAVYVVGWRIIFGA
jgi:membrane protease YdiL (CAAX protease family)